MSKHSSEEEYEKAKAKHKAIALEKEKMIQQDLNAIRRKYIPKHLKRKLITGCAVFGIVYLAEEFIFGKKVPGIVKFMGALAATAMAPKLYSFIQDHYLIIGESSALGEVSTLSPEPDDILAENLPEEDGDRTLEEHPGIS